ncbi:hypothetical protein A9Q91_05430 [Candidatus Gracilibacteria bacterium 28_42_T64]|nr:hypothetical protein A9Q91_05430 [Candidatus Gracilibacteria bacterium 28_42_T64]
MREAHNPKLLPYSVGIQGLIEWGVLVQCHHSLNYCPTERDEESLKLHKEQIVKNIDTFAKKNPWYMKRIINKQVLVNTMMDIIKGAPQKCSKCEEEKIQNDKLD